MRRRNKLIFGGLVMSVALAASCGSSEDDNGDTTNCNNGETVTYSAHIQPLMEAHCNQCHASDVTGADRQAAPANINYDTYADAKANALSGSTRVVAGTMPPLGFDIPTVPEDKRCFLRAWADAGFPE